MAPRESGHGLSQQSERDRRSYLALPSYGLAAGEVDQARTIRLMSLCIDPIFGGEFDSISMSGIMGRLARR